MERQEIFDTVARHLLTQMAKAVRGRSPAGGPDDSCMYRAPSGRKCAVGCLIPDSVYTPNIEGASVCATVEGQALFPEMHSILERLNLLERSKLKLIVELQDVHDMNHRARCAFCTLDHLLALQFNECLPGSTGFDWFTSEKYFGLTFEERNYLFCCNAGTYSQSVHNNLYVTPEGPDAAREFADRLENILQFHGL